MVKALFLIAICSFAASSSMAADYICGASDPAIGINIHLDGNFNSTVTKLGQPGVKCSIVPSGLDPKGNMVVVCGPTEVIPASTLEVKSSIEIYIFDKANLVLRTATYDIDDNFIPAAQADNCTLK